MATSYPAGFDSFDVPSDPANTPLGDAGDSARTHTSLHEDVGDAVEAVQAELGTDPSGASATVGARIAVVESSAAGLPFGRFTTGRYYGSQQFAATGTASAVVQDTLRGTMFFVGETTTFDRVGIFHSSNFAGSSYRMGVYEDNGGAPSALIVDAGTIDTATGSGAFKEIIISQELSIGVYWLVGVSQGGNPAMGVWSATDDFSSALNPSYASGPGASVNAKSVVFRTSVAGALPDPFGAATLDDPRNVPSPSVVLRSA